jgi:hypothetical protein
MFRGADGGALGPFAQGGYSGGAGLALGCNRISADIVRVDAIDAAYDTTTGENANYTSYYTTRWLHAGWPELKKSWRRPSFIVKESAVGYTLNVRVFTDYDEANPRRIFQLIVGAAGDGIIYDDGDLYDDGHLYAAAVKGATIERGSSLGPGRAVQLRLDGEPSKAWGVNAITFKYMQRRFR